MRVRYLARPTNSLSVPLFLCASLEMATSEMYCARGNSVALKSLNEPTWKPVSWGLAEGSWESCVSGRQTWLWFSCRTEGICPRLPPEAWHQQSHIFRSESRSLLWSPSRKKVCSLGSCHSQAASSSPQSTSCWSLTWLQNYDRIFQTDSWLVDCLEYFLDFPENWSLISIY